MIKVVDNNKVFECTEGDKVNITFNCLAYENADNLEFAPSCGCTSVEGPKKAKAGETFKISAVFNSRGRFGDNLKSIKISSGEFETKAKFKITVK